VLTPPDGLRSDAVRSALAQGWGLAVVSLGYLALGFGSHHWEAVDSAGTRWFVTVDELASRRWSRAEPLDAVCGRLGASLAVASDLSELGLSIAVAPVPTWAGGPLLRLTDRFAVSLYPFTTGQSFTWGAFSSPEHRRAVLDLVVAVHTAPPAARGHAIADDFTIACRDALEATMTSAGGIGGAAPRGRYERAASALIAEYGTSVRLLLARYDALVSLAKADLAKADSVRPVLTHGEPHPGNTMLTPGGWRLIDWDTAAIAPPERDLCSLDPGDGSILAAYHQATGVTPRPGVLELYRLRWDLTDVALGAERFSSSHSGNADDEQTFALLGQLLKRLERLAATGHDG
jgi:hypothetical protein